MGEQNSVLKPISFDFEGDIYGKTIEVFWLDYIRDMIKFNNIDELCAQLEADKKNRGKILRKLAKTNQIMYND